MIWFEKNKPEVKIELQHIQCNTTNKILSNVYVYVRVLRKLRGVLVFEIPLLVFEITKTKTPKFTIKFDLKFSGKDRT